MELRAARIGEREEVLDLLAQWYNDRFFFARYNHHDPAFSDDLCLIARDHGRLISTVQIFDRWINLGGEPVRMGGIGSVYTRPEDRGRGAASALLQLALQKLAQWGFEASLLFAERTDYYQRFGWKTVERQFTALFSAHTAAIAGGAALARFDPGRDLTAVAAIYTAYSSRFPLTVHRDNAYWLGNLKYAGNPNEYFVVGRSGGVIAAYARAMCYYDFPLVMEYGYLPGAETVLLQLFKHLAQITAGEAGELGPAPEPVLAGKISPQGAGLLVTHSIHDSGLEQQLARAGVQVAHHPDRFNMWRGVAPQRLGPRLGVSADLAEAKLIELAASPSALYWTSDRF